MLTGAVLPKVDLKSTNTTVRVINKPLSYDGKRYDIGTVFNVKHPRHSHVLQLQRRVEDYVEAEAVAAAELDDFERKALEILGGKKPRKDEEDEDDTKKPELKSGPARKDMKPAPSDKSHKGKAGRYNRTDMRPEDDDS